MQSTQLRPLIAQYLSEAKLMQLATCVDNQPWVCSVWFAADDDLNLYWFSSGNRRHSHEVEANELVAAAIALPHTPDDIPRGLQLQGTASLLTEEASILKARSCYIDRIFTEDKVDELVENPDRPHRFYQLRPTRFVLFDALNFPDNSRQQLEMP